MEERDRSFLSLIRRLEVGERRTNQRVSAAAQELATIGLAQALEDVHVLRGDLKATGRVEKAASSTHRSFITATIAFGGKIGISRFVFYAEIERSLGGDHDFYRNVPEAIDAAAQQRISDIFTEVLG